MLIGFGKRSFLQDQETFILPEVKKYINGLQSTYAFFQLQAANSDDNSSILLECSCKIRNFLNGLIYDLDKSIEQCLQAENITDEIEKLYDFTADLSQLWHFSEIFFFNYTNKIFEEVIIWLQSCIEDLVPLLTKEVEELFSSAESPELVQTDETCDDFWTVIYRLSLRGRFAEAWSILCLHSELAIVLKDGQSEDAQCLSAMESVFFTHPVLQFPTNTSTPYDIDGFAALHEQWRARVQHLQSAGFALLARVPELSPLLRVFYGDSRALSRLRATSFWQEQALVDLLFTSNPFLSRRDLLLLLERRLSGSSSSSSSSDPNAADNTDGYDPFLAVPLVDVSFSF
eukprot:gene3539-7038_t